LLDVNPVTWLVCRDRWQAYVLWATTLLMLAVWVLVFASNPSTGLRYLWGFLGAAFVLLLYLAAASQSGRLLVDARRSGLIELLLATPVSAAQIIRGLWTAFTRMFGLALTLCLAAQFIGQALVQQATWDEVAQSMASMPTTATIATNTVPAGTNQGVTTSTTVMTNGSVTVTTVSSSGTAVTVTSTPAGGSPFRPHVILPLAIALASIIAVVANLIALAWFGMWMGLTSRNTSLATLKTILFVQIIPWFVISFLSALSPMLLLPRLTQSFQNPNPAWFILWYPLLSTSISTILFVAKDLVFSLWARRRLYAEFRERAAIVDAAVRTPTPPPLPRLAP
jgi:hypothetical protein